MIDAHYLLLSALLTWVMLLTASLMRSRGWTPSGLVVALGNRDDVPEPSPAAARADRAAKNMLENLVLFAAVLAGARMLGATGAELASGAAVFFYARIAYFVLYLAGAKYVRTLVWTVSLAGLVMIAHAALAR